MTTTKVAGVGCLTVALMAMLSTGAVQAARDEIDTLETRITYETRYLAFIPVSGVFARMTGNLQYEPTKPVGERGAYIEVVIDATTLKPTTFDGESTRRMLRGPAFFDVDRFPSSEFRSSKFRYEGEKLIAIDGDIKLVGVSKPVTLKVLKSGCEPASATRVARCTASTELTVKRFEFGMKDWSGIVSDNVIIAVELVALATDALPSVVAPATPGSTVPTLIMVPLK